MRKWKVLLFTFIVGGAFTYASAWPVTQACTPGFYKNHPEFITGTTTCLSGLSQNTLVSEVFASVDANSCVGEMSLLQLLKSDSSACGAGGGSTLEGAEIILLRQAITRMLNATNSTGACWAAKHAISASDAAIDTDNLNTIKNQASIFNNLNNDKPCTLGD
jgi:hypothetical protein